MNDFTKCVSGGIVSLEDEFYTVYFNPNGGDGGYVFTDVPAGEFVIPDVYVLRSGYLFRGWNTRPDGSGEYFYEGDIIIVETDVTLYAIWETIFYTIILEPGAGEGYPVAFTYESGSVFIMPEPYELGFSLAGYRFIGWLGNGGYLYYPGEQIFVSDTNLIFVAQWERNTFAVIFEPNGGSGFPVDFFYEYGSIITLPYPEELGFYRTGYTFSNWRDEDGVIFGAGDTFVVPNRDVRFFAVWTENIYRINFEPNGGEGNAVDFLRYYQSELIIPSAEENVNGFFFLEASANSRFPACVPDFPIYKEPLTPSQ